MNIDVTQWLPAFLKQHVGLTYEPPKFIGIELHSLEQIRIRLHVFPLHVEIPSFEKSAK